MPASKMTTGTATPMPIFAPFDRLPGLLMPLAKDVVAEAAVGDVVATTCDEPPVSEPVRVVVGVGDVELVG